MMGMKNGVEEWMQQRCGRNTNEVLTMTNQGRQSLSAGSPGAQPATASPGAGAREQWAGAREQWAEAQERSAEVLYFPHRSRRVA